MPSFFPPLFLQRRAFILKALKESNATSCLEIGCGEGQILNALCQPAAHLEDPEAILAGLGSSSTDSTKELHLTRIAGLDIDAAALSRAKIATAPSTTVLTEEEEVSGLKRSDLRWEALDVKLWLGSLDVYNHELAQYAAVICSEVIEHLPEEILCQFGDMVLGRYRHHTIIVTTPNYDFHDQFAADDSSKSYPDPTGRTNRIFRHDDHQFEFTASEFKDWCNDLAAKHRYEVVYSGVGDLATYKPNLQPTGLYASQCATFTRIDDSSNLVSNAAKESQDESGPNQKHQLFCHQDYPYFDAGPQSHEVIREAVAIVLDRMDSDSASVRELWSRFIVSKSCAGSLKKLIEAIQSCKDRSWQLETVAGDIVEMLSGLESVLIKRSPEVLGQAEG